MVNTGWGTQDSVHLPYKWLNSTVYGRYNELVFIGICYGSKRPTFTSLRGPSFLHIQNAPNRTVVPWGNFQAQRGVIAPCFNASRVSPSSEPAVLMQQTLENDGKMG